MAYEKMTFSSSMSETCKINLQVDSKISSRGVCFCEYGNLENHTNIPDLVPTNCPLQALRYRLGYHKYRDNLDVEPVVTQCPVFLTEDTKVLSTKKRKPHLAMS
jgi:hypothetical protein